MTKQSVSPHSLKLSDHVYQRMNPHHQGTVTRIDTLSFTITYDGPRVLGAKMRFTYPISRMDDFLVGTPNPDILIWDKEVTETSDGTG
jgi:hypothetical protein